MKHTYIKLASKAILLKGAILLITVLAGTLLSAQTKKPAYLLYGPEGKNMKYEKMLKAAAEADVVLFGEYHTNPISHWLQLELTRELYEARGGDLVLGAEMFESDNQLIMNEYLQGWITEKKFEEEARLWKNYETDYKPLVLIAKDNGLPFIATNIPRRYANMVFKRGVASLDSISDEARSYISPLPLEYDKSLNCYSQLMGGDSTKPEAKAMPGATMPGKAMSGATMPGAVADSSAKAAPDEKAPMMAMKKSSGPGMHGSSNLADAQAIKDATMAHFILQNFSPGQLFVHYQGAYHSDNYESMNWFLLKARPGLKIVTISTVSQEDISELEEEAHGKADFIIAVPETMTKTSR